MRVTLVKMPNSGDMETASTLFGSQTGALWRNGDTNPSTTFLTPNCSCLKEIKHQKWSRDWSNVCPVTGSTWDLSNGQSLTLLLMHVLLADRSLAWLSSERLFPATVWDRCRYPQPSMGNRLATPMEELGEGLKELKGMPIPRETNSVN